MQLTPGCTAFVFRPHIEAAQLAADKLGVRVESLKLKAKATKKISKWKHVTYHKLWGRWAGQHAGKTICSCDTPEEAAKLVAKYLGRTMESLRKVRAVKPAKHKASKFRHVHFHARRGKWYAQTPGEFLGTFDSELAAANAVVEAGHAEDTDDLRLKKCKERRGTPLANAPVESEPARKTSVLTRETFQAMWNIYSERSGPAIPGDLEDLLGNDRMSFTGKAKHFGAVYCLLKYGPARQAFADTWDAMPKRVKNANQDSAEIEFAATVSHSCSS